MNNLINTLVLTSSLVTGNTDHSKLTESDLIIQQLDINRSDYIKADFISAKDEEIYIKREHYSKKQQKVTNDLKKKRIADVKKRELKKQQIKIAKQKEAQRLELLRQQQLQKEKEVKLEKSQKLHNNVVNEATNEITPSSNETQSPQKQQNNTTQKNTNHVQSSSKTYQITHYTANCSGCTGITSFGYSVRDTIYYNGMRIVAADPSIPLGTKLRVTYTNGSSFTAIVLDRGGAIKGNILDVLVSSNEEAYRLGRTTATVSVVN